MSSEIDPEQTIIITDTNIYKYYSTSFPARRVLKLEPGEDTKSLSTIEHLVKEMLKLDADRSSFLLGIGGGVIGDITGFVASVYMRGIRFGLISTSLLSQVDASTGGKNGVNAMGYKNVIGSFTQPEFVFCDTSMLATLPGIEFKSGLAEVVKHALIRDYKLFEYLEKEALNINEGNRLLMDELVRRSVEVKISIVEKDEREAGERRLLNFGHTIGHAIESASRLKHGMAVAAGIYFALQLSLEKNFLSGEGYDRAVNLLKSLGLINEEPLMLPSYLHAIEKDKKKDKEAIRFVLLEDIGKAFCKELSIKDLQAWMETKF